MNLLYKEDWEETKARYRAWWNHEAIGRCAMSVVAPRKNPPPTPRPPEAKTVEEKWYDLDLIGAWAEYNLSRTFFGGEALPIWSGGYAGHTSIPAYLGCPTALDMHTGWWDPILTGEDIVFRSLHINKESRNYRFACDLLRRGVRESKGRALVSIGAFGGCGDTLAGLRGTERLLYDCVERPDQVRAAEDFLMDMWCEVYDGFHAIIREADEGSTCWFGLWSPGRFYASHNDFAYNIGPTMFRDLFLPAIEKQTRFLDHTIHHVDGVNNFIHIAALCELPRLQALQILPGAGKPSALHYPDTLKQVQSAGKNLWIVLPASEVEEALSRLSARGLFIATHCETEDEARQLLKSAEKWSRD